MAEVKYLNETGLSYLKDKMDATYAPLESPALTGTPTAPTAVSGTATTQIATTAFVDDAISGISSALVFKGSVNAVSNLPTVGTTVVGSVYNIATKGETTADFIEGAGKVVDAGANVACVEASVSYTVVDNPTGNPSANGWYEETSTDVYEPTSDTEVDGSKTYYVRTVTKKWDILGGNFDVSDLEADIQTRLKVVTTMPTGAALSDGMYVLYLGTTTTTPDLVKGRVYQYNESDTEWVLVSNGMIAITNAEIDALFV